MTDEVQTVDVPAQHADLFARIVALLKKDEQWVLDNIHAGVATLESMFEDKTEAAPVDAAPSTPQA